MHILGTLPESTFQQWGAQCYLHSVVLSVTMPATAVGLLGFMLLGRPVRYGTFSYTSIVGFDSTFLQNAILCILWSPSKSLPWHKSLAHCKQTKFSMVLYIKVWQWLANPELFKQPNRGHLSHNIEIFSLISKCQYSSLGLSKHVHAWFKIYVPKQTPIGWLEKT